MKKFKYVLISFCLCFCLFFLYGCGNNNPGQDGTYESFLSEYRKNLFVNKNSNYLVTFTSGERESNYIMDGKVSSLVDFGVLTLKFEKSFAGSKLQFELKIDDDTYAGEFERNPYDNTFVYDIGKQVSDDSKLTLYLVDFDETLDLKCWSSEWEYSYKDALKVFVEKHKEQIDACMKDNNLQGEIFIKTVAEDSNLNDIYWYCLLVGQNGEMFASLISVKTGQILQNS